MPVVGIRRGSEVGVSFEVHDRLRQGGLAVKDDTGCAENLDHMGVLCSDILADCG